MAKTKRRFEAEEGQEKKADMSESSKFDKKKIICPLTLAATTKINKKPLGVNYTCVPEPTMEVDESGEPGAWYSSPKGRTFDKAFYQELERRKGLPEDDAEHIAWSEDGYYFSNEEGVEAYEKYEQMCIDGKTTVDGEEIPVKANKKSWNNKHSITTGVSWDELTAMHPDLYKTSTTSKASKSESDESSEALSDEAAEDLVADAELEDLDMSDEEVQELEDEYEDLKEAAPKMAAAEDAVEEETATVSEGSQEVVDEILDDLGVDSVDDLPEVETEEDELEEVEVEQS